MSTRSALAGAVTAAALVAALGNPAVTDAARDADDPVLARTVTDFSSWDIARGTHGDVVAGVVLRVALGIVLTGLLSALAGRTRSRGAAFIGGWGALTVAAGLAGAVFHIYMVAVPLEGGTLGPSYLDGLAAAANAGASFGLWTGWLVGGAVALATRLAPVAAPVAATAITGAARGGGTRSERHITEPPPPWWAPTRVEGDGAPVRPGPSVFPPGGLRSATSEATYDMATASGDPHPSDPDATHAVGMPRPDTDGTTAASAEPPDSTVRMPRQSD